MALSKNTTTVHGFTVSNAYYRVEGIFFEDKNKISFRLRTYKETGKPFFADESFKAPYDLNGPNPFAQAYQFLKTLPEFADAVDC